MANVYQTKDRNGKPHPKWRFQYVNWQGKRKTATGKTGKKATIDLATKVEVEHNEIRKGFRQPPKNSEKSRFREIEEIVREYLDWGQSQGGRKGRPWSEVHMRKRRSQIDWWIKNLTLEVLADLEGILSKVEKSLRSLQQEGRSGKTLSNYAETLKTLCNWCVARGYLENNPLKNLSAFDLTPKTIRRALTSEEIHKLLQISPPHRRLLYETVFCSGLRASELRALTTDDLDVDNCGLHLRAEWTKNREPGFQPLPRLLIDRLTDFVNTGEVNELYRKHFNAKRTPSKPPQNPLVYITSHPARSLDIDLKVAGIPKVTQKGKVDFHACRVAYITYVLDAGAKLKEAQCLARHSDPKLTMNIYARAFDERLSDIAESVGETILGNDCRTFAEQQSDDNATFCNLISCEESVEDSTPPASIFFVPRKKCTELVEVQ